MAGRRKKQENLTLEQQLEAVCVLFCYIFSRTCFL